MQLNESIKLFLDEQQHSLNFFQKNAIEINQICKRLVIARNKGKKIFAMGNGGSG
jgi:phosphoheptose isomerase